MSITVWDKGEQFCGQCKATKRDLDKAGVVYETRDITAPENAERLAAFKAAGVAQAPIVETPTNTWSGYSPDQIKGAAATAQAAQASTVAAGPVVTGPSAN